MNAKISVLVICVEAIIYLLYNLHDCTFNKSDSNVLAEVLNITYLEKRISEKLTLELLNVSM